MEAGKRKIEDLFNKGRVLEVPFFQRSYVWKEENWERFINDMQIVSTSDREYFMGSIILKTQPVSSAEDIGDWRIIVDGQQRLTTIMLFFKALCRAQNNESLFKGTFYNRGSRIILKHSHNDIEIFEAIVEDKLTESLAQNFGENNLLGCFKYFSQKTKELKDININRIMNKLYFVGIDLGVEEDEQQIFDTINSLGVSLTTAELLKNELFKRADEELYKITWFEIFEKDEDSRSYWDQEVTAGRQRRVNTDLLLQSFLLIISNAQDKYLGLESLFSNFKSYIKDANIDKTSLVNSLIEYAKLYQENINPGILGQDIDRASRMDRLNTVIFGLNTTTIVPYILYILKEVPAKEERDKIFSLLESYLVRRLICRETTKNYNNLFASLIRNKVASYELFKEKIYNSEDPTNRFPDNSDLKTGLEESNLTNQQAKVVLYLVEKSIRDEKYSTNLLPINDYSLEHIMPKKWRNNWGRVNDDQARIRDNLLKKLGNLTIITMPLNGSIVDAKWDTKKHGRNGKKGLEEYAKGIRIIDKYLKYDIWDESAIVSRGNELFEFSKDIWPFDMSLASPHNQSQNVEARDDSENLAARPSHKKAYDRDMYLELYSPNSVEEFYRVLDQIDSAVVKNKWNLVKRFRKTYMYYLMGNTKVFGLDWYNNNEFGLYFKVSKKGHDILSKLSPYALKYHERTGSSWIEYSNQISIDELVKVFEKAHALHSQK